MINNYVVNKCTRIEIICIFTIKALLSLLVFNFYSDLSPVLIRMHVPIKDLMA